MRFQKPQNVCCLNVRCTEIYGFPTACDKMHACKWQLEAQFYFMSHMNSNVCAYTKP